MVVLEEFPERGVREFNTGEMEDNKVGTVTLDFKFPLGAVAAAVAAVDLPDADDVIPVDRDPIAVVVLDRDDAEEVAKAAFLEAAELAVAALGSELNGATMVKGLAFAASDVAVLDRISPVTLKFPLESRRA
jgi:hypothetical protein